MDYPIWRYHKTLKPEGKIVRSAEADDTQGPGWVYSTADFDKEPLPTKVGGIDLLPIKEVKKRSTKAAPEAR